MNKTLSTIYSALKFRLMLVEQIGTELNCQNEQPHSIEFKINQLPEERFSDLRSKLKLPVTTTKQHLIHTLRQTATIV